VHDARTELTGFHGVFVDRNCLFVSTASTPEKGILLSGYVNCEVIFPFYPIMKDLVWQLISPFLGEVEGFLCPSTGDIVLIEYATILANLAGVRTVAAWADKQPDNSYRVVRNSFESALRGKNILVLNDRISQGETTKKVLAEAERLHCHVLGVATIAGVSHLSAQYFGVPELNMLTTIDVDSFPDDVIPERYQGLPIVVDEALGHGWGYSLDHPDYPGGFIRLLADTPLSKTRK